MDRDTNKDNVVSFELARREAATVAAPPDPNAIPEFIKPRSITDMTETEALAHLTALRERRLRYSVILNEQQEKKANLASAVSRAKVEKKIEQVKRQEEKVDKQIEKLEELVYQLRALIIQVE